MSYEEKLGLAYFIDLGTKCNMEGSALIEWAEKKKAEAKKELAAAQELEDKKLKEARDFEEKKLKEARDFEEKKLKEALAFEAKKLQEAQAREDRMEVREIKRLELIQENAAIEIRKLELLKTNTKANEVKDGKGDDKDGNILLE